MHVVSRRDLIRSSGMVLALPAIGTQLPAFAAGQTPRSSVASKPQNKLLPFSSDLDSYVAHTFMAMNIKQDSEGTVNPKDYSSAAGFLHLFARHISSTQVDSDFKANVAQLNPDSLSDALSPAKLKPILAQGSHSVSDDTAALVSALCLSSPSSVSESMKRLATAGISGTHHTTATLLKEFAEQHAASIVSSSYAHAHLGAQRRDVCVISDDWCKDFAAAIADTALLATIVGLACAIAMGSIITAPEAIGPCTFLLGASLSGAGAAAVVLSATVLYKLLGCPTSYLGLYPS